MSRRSHHVTMLDCAKRNEITAFIPPEYAVRVAMERTSGMVDYFWTAVRRVSFVTAYDYVQRLANSAYLQGVNDAAIAMAQTGMMKEPQPK